MPLAREAVYSEECPNCKATNYFSVGDPEDLTAPDTDGIKCWSCKHEWLFDDDDGFDDISEAYIEDGRKKI